MANKHGDEPRCITACGGEVESEMYIHSPRNVQYPHRAAIPGFYTIQNVRGNV